MTICGLINALGRAIKNKKRMGKSYPNGIPCMSAATNLVYDIGQEPLGGWTFDALDWNTGKSVFCYRFGTTPVYNSAYAGTKILTNGSLYSGTLFGMVRMTP
ncbi:MAG: hypothetical protein B5M56_04925 [Desulfococcus sp. 4484_241]|nr:MAG: hypothetical protein B5M56_04925 [Desulfococcus sp. 4484_241]